MRDYKEFLERKKRQYGDKFDASDLAPQFIPYYENGKRIEVKFSYNEVKRGTIGITTGWRPVFLLMLTKRSIGSSYTLREADKIVKTVNGILRIA